MTTRLLSDDQALAIVGYLVARPRATSAEIAEGLGRRYQAVVAKLRWMQSEGYVIPAQDADEKPQRWVLVESGLRTNQQEVQDAGSNTRPGQADARRGRAA